MSRNESLLAKTIPARVQIAMCCAVATTAMSVAYSADEQPAADVADVPNDTRATLSEPSACIPLAAARDRAVLMHQIYATTLDVIHAKYFHSERAIIPARAMEDVFEALERERGFSAHWISVNLKAMSINHDPKTDFEKQAARVLGDGKPEYESVDNGVYRRATPILLNDGCLGCHSGFGSRPSKAQKLAGLVISIPVLAEEPRQP